MPKKQFNWAKKLRETMGGLVLEDRSRPKKAPSVYDTSHKMPDDLVVAANKELEEIRKKQEHE